MVTKEYKNTVVSKAVNLLLTAYYEDEYEYSLAKSAESYYQKDNDAHYIVDMLKELKYDIEAMIEDLEDKEA